MDESRRFQRKADLRIGGQIGGAGLLVKAAVGDDVSGRTESEIERTSRWPLARFRGLVDAGPRRASARDMQRFQEAFGDGIALAPCEPARPRRRVEALDRYHVGHAESGEGIAHIAFPDEAAQV